MTDQDVRDFLERMAAEEPVKSLDAEPLTRRARRRAARTVVVGALGVAAAIAVVFAGTVQLREASLRVPADPPEEHSVDLGIFEPAAGRIVYYTDSSLWAVDPNAPSPVSTLAPLDLGTADADGQFASFTVPLGWSSEGTELLFLREDPGDQAFPYDRLAYILHADGTETQVTPEPIDSAAISPDGTRVVYTSWASDGLFVVDAEGGQPVRIAAFGEGPTFSPDGTQIAFLALPRGKRGVPMRREHVWIANADGTDAREILADEPALTKGVFGLTWSPAGDRIAMENSLEGHIAIYTFAPDGSNFTEVITGGFDPHWSPDGSQIAYGVPGRDGVSLADADGSNVRTFGFGGSGPWHPGTLGESAGPSPSPAPSTSPRPSPSPVSTRFTSTIQGISIDHPSDWQVRPATEPWNKDAFTFDAPGVDVIFDPTLQDDLYLSLASLPLAGQSAEDWCCSKLRASLWASAQVCETGGNLGRITVDGAEATIRGCDGFGNAFEDHVVQVATATHGYVIYLHVGDDPILQATYTEAWFDAALETVELR